MGKLYELLAAAPTAVGQATKCVTDLTATFNGKKHLFGKKITTFIPNQEGAAQRVEEQSDIQSTVAKELNWIQDIWAKAIDLSYQIDESNMTARSDIKLDDGTVLAEGVPATALLQLEKRVQDMHNFLVAVPTLDPAKGFTKDVNENDIHIARTTETFRTKKVQKPIVLFPATPEHPAQTQLIVEDIEIGRLQHQEWSGMITPKEKADMLSRCEQLARAVKAARSRSNDVVASDKKIGGTFFAFVFGGRKG